LDFILRADALAMFFVTLSGLLWFLTTLYAIAYLEGSPHRSRFFGFFSLCVSATVGIALAGNLFTFVMFYELLTLATYPLVVHRETETVARAGERTWPTRWRAARCCWRARRGCTRWFPRSTSTAGRRSPVWEANINAPARHLCLLIVGMGVKAALVPLHGWLPQAMVAPAPVSACCTPWRSSRPARSASCASCTTFTESIVRTRWG
jgi:multicomponent Na+:H+ antiporter subunit D